MQASHAGDPPAPPTSDTLARQASAPPARQASHPPDRQASDRLPRQGNEASAQQADETPSRTARDVLPEQASDTLVRRANDTPDQRASDTLDALRRAGLRAATAESCTGGLVAAALTAIAGSSDVVHGGFVTYANEAKTAMLGVDPRTIETVGAVSEAVARAMAEGARARTGVDLAVAITGVAGPGGGSPEKPVGTVWFAVAGPRGTGAEHHRFDGDRAAIRDASVRVALDMLRRAAVT